MVRKKTRRVAWNGVRLEVPSSWEPAEIGNRFLLFHDREGPALEVSWKIIPGRFNPEKAVKKLARARSRKGARIKKTEMPRDFEKAVAGKSAAAFVLEGRGKGFGLVLHCETCHTVTVFRFFDTKDEFPRARAARILRSFKDHSRTGRVEYRIFDISAKMPEAYALVRHQFAPGAFELSFRAGDAGIALHRFGPAEALLAAQGLAPFMGKRVTIPENVEGPLERTFRGKPAVEWSAQAQGSRLQRALSPKKRRTGWFFLRAWVDSEKNRILALSAAGGVPLAREFLDGVMADYEIL